MKFSRILQLFLFWMPFNLIHAQQSILLNQSAYNLFVLNPAAIGLKNELNVNCHYKKNWMGLSESPELIQLTVDGSLSKNKYGLGLNVINEKAGIFSKTYLSGAFRYKVNLSKTNHLLFGLSAGFQKQQSDFSKIKADSPEEFAQWPQQQAVTIPDATFGLIYSYRKILITASAAQLLNQDYTYTEPVFNKQLKYQTIPHFLFSIQNTFTLRSEKWKYTPLLIFRTPQGLPVQLDLLNTLMVNDKFLVGIGYRYSYATYVNLGYSFSEKLRIIYSYEYSLGIQTATNGGHEIGLRFGLLSGNKKINHTKGEADERKLDEIYDKLDQHDHQIESLSKKVDSLDKNINALKSQIDYLKNQQINQNEIKEVIESYMKKAQSISSFQNDRTPNAPAENNRINTPGKYKVISPKSERDFENSKDSTIANYKIVLGVYQILDYAKSYQKFLIREVKLETQLIQLLDHPKKYIYVCAIKEYTNLNAALKELKQMRINLKAQSLELTRGEAWILQTLIN